MIRVLVLILLCNIAFAQKTESRSTPYAIDEIKTQSYSFPAYEFPNNEKQIAQYLSQKITNLSSPLSSLNLLYTKESMGGKHFCFNQSINGINVYRTQIKVNILNNKKAVQVFALTFSPEIISSENFSDADPSAKFIQSYQDVSKSNSTKIYYFHQSKLIPAYHIYIEKKGCLSFEYILNSNGTIIYNNDLLSYSGKKDSAVVFTVFNPDPITSAQTTYGTPYADNSNADNVSLHNELKQKNLTVKFENDTFYLENDYYTIADVDSPNNTPTTSKTNSFNFNRSEGSFEDANSFYHINIYRNHLKALGFNNLVDHPLWIDAHAHAGSDNSSFNEYSSPVTLLYGDGGVDDAEDADVVVHEFGHFISAQASPFSNSGSGGRSAIDEGFGDYLAASYSRSISEYQWSDIFNWDGHNEFWTGRTAATTNHYPENFKSNKWSDGQMWSSTLMQLQDDIAPYTLDSIVFQALYGQAQNTSMPDAAYLLLDADTALFNGKHTAVISWRLATRGFIPSNDTQEITTEPSIEVFNSYAFSKGGALNISFQKPEDATLELYDVSGRLIEKTSISNTNQATYSTNNIDSGVYLLKISTSVKSLTIKLLRY